MSEGEGACVGEGGRRRTIQAVALCDLKETGRPKRALCVDVQRLALPAPLVQGQLAGHAQHVAQLCLAGAELAKQLRDAASFNAACQGRGEGGGGEEERRAAQ